MLKLHINGNNLDERINDPADLPFSFIYGGKPFREFAAALTVREEIEPETSGMIKSRVIMKCPATGLEVVFEKLDYTSYPIIDWTLYFRNTSNHDTPVIEDIQALDIGIPVENDLKNVLHHPVVHHFVGSRPSMNDFEPLETHLAWNDTLKISTCGGRPSSSDMPYFNFENIDTGIFIAIGWPGQWTVSFSRFSVNQEEIVQIRAGQSKTHFKLFPGEELRGPRIVLLPYTGSFIDCQNLWRRWVRDHNQPKLHGQRLKPQFCPCNSNFYEGLRTVASTEIQFMQGYLDHGFTPDFWIQDAGWYPCEKSWVETGLWWEADSRRFPNGIREVSDYCHQKGIGTVVWFEPERVYPGTWIYENKPEWVIKLEEGKTGLLRLGDNNCREWITNKIATFMNDQCIDIYRQDFNMDPLPYWEHEDAHDRQGVAEIRHVSGYLAYWDELLRRNPGMYIDTCASGGKRLDIETLRRSVPILRSDAVFELHSNQCQTYGLSFLIPFQGTGMGEIDEYYIRSLMLPEFTIGIDTRNDNLDYATLHRFVNEWQKIAGLMLEGDYYPLTPYSLKDDVWIAWQFDVPEKGEGFIQAFRRENCLQDTARYGLLGLDANADYLVENFDGGIDRISGRSLMKDGICISTREKPKASIISYKKV